MNSLRLLPFILLSGGAAAFGQTLTTSDNAKPAAAPTAPIAEHDRLVQEFMAERAKLLEARQALKAQAKQAGESKNTKAVKDAEKASEQLEKDFLVKNAELIRQMKAAEEAKKAPRPAPPVKKSSAG